MDIPTTISSTFHTWLSWNTAEKRSSTYTPAFTTAAACRNADTGVAAAIASGNQKWKGNWADFVNAATANNTAKVVARPGRSTQNSDCKISCKSVVPAAVAVIAVAAKRDKPPVNVNTNVRIAPASPPEPARAIKKKEPIETNSQAINSTTMSLASTSNNTASMNADMIT